MRRRGRDASILSLVAALALAASLAGATSFNDVPADHWAAAAIDAITDAGIMEGCGGSFFCPYALVSRGEISIWLGRVQHYQGGIVPPEATGDFLDVPAQSCRADWIELLGDDGLTKGCHLNPPLFCPRKTVSRAEIAVFLLRLLYGKDFQPPLCTSRPPSERYEDVPCPGYWAADWIEQVHADGLSAGCLENPPMYCPHGAVNRAQAAMFLVRVICEKYGGMCALVEAPQGGPDQVDVTLDDGDQDHELVGE